MSKLIYTNQLLTTATVPLRYLVVPKCACTFVKNLIWKIDATTTSNKVNRIHDYKFLRASDLGLTENDIAREQYAFTIIRNPIDRFFSLYCDKVVGEGHKHYIPLRKILIMKYGLMENPSSIKEHRRNCHILIRWIGLNLKTDIDFKAEAHWTPQIYRKKIMLSCDLKLLTVDDLERQLKFLMQPIIPNIGELVESFENFEKNKSKFNYSRQQVITKDLRKEINLIYKDDQNLYRVVKNGWSQVNFSNYPEGQIPSTSTLFKSVEKPAPEMLLAS